MATAIFEATDRSGTRRPTADDARALDALAYAIDRGERIVLLDGSSRFRRSALLLELARRIERTHDPVLASGDLPEPGGELIEQIRAMADLPLGADPLTLVSGFFEWSAIQERPAAVLVDEAHRFSAAALQGLIQLIQRAEGRASVVLAVPDYKALLSVLRGDSSFVDLVRLGGERANRDWLRRPAGAARSVRPGREPRTAKGPRRAGAPDSRRSDSDVRPAPSVSEPPARDRDEHLSTIEELLGSVERVAEAPSLHESSTAQERAGGQPASNAPARVDSPSAVPPSSAECAAPSPTRVVDPEVGQRERLGRPVSDEILDPVLLRAEVVPSRPVDRAHRRWKRWVALVGGIGMLGLSFLALNPSPKSGSDRLAETITPEVSSPPAVESARQPARRQPAEPVRAEAAVEPPRDAPPDLVTLQDALTILSMDPPPRNSTAAIRFLNDHGPDAVAYDYLAGLASREARTPTEAARMLTVQSRLRLVLCSVWADDPRGVAPVRLGCPGAVSNLP